MHRAFNFLFTKQLLIRAGADPNRTHIIYATGEQLPNDEILSASMVAFVLEKYGIKDIRIVDGGLPAYKAAGITKIRKFSRTLAPRAKAACRAST